MKIGQTIIVLLANVFHRLIVIVREARRQLIRHFVMVVFERQGDERTRHIRPRCIEFPTTRGTIAQCHVEFVAIVVLRGEMRAAVQLGEVAIGPHQAIAQETGPMAEVLFHQYVHAIGFARACGQLVVPRTGARQLPHPFAIVQEVRHALIPSLHRDIPAVFVGVITADAQLVARRRSVNLRHGHPIVGGQRQIAHTHLLHILRHARIARLHTHRGTEKIGRRHARLHRKIVFTVHQEVGQTQTRVHPPCFRGAPFGIAVQCRLVPLHHLLAIRLVQDRRLTAVRDTVFGRKTVVGVVQAEAQRQGQLRCPHPLRACIPIVDTVANFLI